MENDNRCIVCGEHIPEGRQVCQICLARWNEREAERIQKWRNDTWELQRPKRIRNRINACLGSLMLVMAVVAVVLDRAYPNTKIALISKLSLFLPLTGELILDIVCFAKGVKHK